MDLNFKSFGNGPALIILHGLFGSLDNWVSHARQLADSYSVYLLDQRNHGKSPHDDQWDYETMADDLEAFMDQQGIYQAHLLGHSMGGKTVMQFAMHFPERIEKLIVADMAPKGYEPHHIEILETLINIDLANFENRQAVAAHMEASIPEMGVRQFLLKSLGRDGQKQFRWKFNLPVIYQNYPKILEPIELAFPFDGPTLFLSGGKSNYVSPEEHELILEGFPEASFVVIPQAGHWLHADSPSEFLQEVRAFLAD
ncbi:MAG: alpha/beta fold hydrolase [Bacteroidota bacterium]